MILARHARSLPGSSELDELIYVYLYTCQLVRNSGVLRSHSSLLRRKVVQLGIFYLFKMPSWGNIVDLYPTLTAPVIESLEKALSAHQRGHLYEAERIILEDLPPSSTNPVIAIALADVYESQGLDYKRAKVLEDALEDPSEWPTEIGNEFTLIRVLAADAVIRSRGSLDSMYDMLMLDKAEVTGFDLNKATDIEASYSWAGLQKLD